MIRTVDDIYLKPCPCCGHKRPEIIGGPLYMAICRNADCQFQIPNCLSVVEAQQKWNSRAFEVSTPHGALIDRSLLLAALWESQTIQKLPKEVENEIVRLITSIPKNVEAEE